MSAPKSRRDDNEATAMQTTDQDKSLDREEMMDLLRKGEELRDQVRKKYEGVRTVSEQKLRFLID